MRDEVTNKALFGEDFIMSEARAAFCDLSVNGQHVRRWNAALNYRSVTEGEKSL
jgi:hypothetical protein